MLTLEKQLYPIEAVCFGPASCLRGTTLVIDRAELERHLEERSGLAEVRVELAAPGDGSRILNVLDICEPCVKEDGSYFPSWVAPPGLVGEGVTRVLRGVAVVETGEMAGVVGGLLDLHAETRQLTPLADLHQVVLRTRPAAGMNKLAYCRAVRAAGLRAAVYLARLALGNPAPRRETYPRSGDGALASPLPKVAYLCLLHGIGDLRETFVYGARIREALPFLLQPTEMLDGAVVSFHYDMPPGVKNNTYSYQRHPLVEDLLRLHGEQLDFRGLVLAPQPVRLEDKQRAARLAARLLRQTLRADGVVMTKEAAGAGDYDLMEHCEACERAGVKTVLIDSEQLNEAGEGLPLIDLRAAADAIVSAGNIEERVHLPAASRLLGGDTFAAINGDPHAATTVSISYIPNSNSSLGFTRLRAVPL
ncbi:MAG: hypothetical protein HYY96_16530 [Candidatus Tectomicrobia bacterium]|nr:hypothetical protein [Candidatus Tectomicrobia bacterium]